MSFENPIKKKVENLENQLQNNDIKNEQIETLEEVKEENIVPLDTILETHKIDIELIDYPKNVIITGVPKNISFKPDELGTILIKYGNQFQDSVTRTI